MYPCWASRYGCTRVGLAAKVWQNLVGLAAKVWQNRVWLTARYTRIWLTARYTRIWLTARCPLWPPLWPPWWPQYRDSLSQGVISLYFSPKHQKPCFLEKKHCFLTRLALITWSLAKRVSHWFLDILVILGQEMTGFGTTSFGN